jgi:NO-binding membrane sensor protein with MHYT domain
MWLFGGAFAMGAGIWSMHFIGMLAFSIPNRPMNYELYWTSLSMMVAVLASGFALYLLKEHVIHVRRLALGGVILGLAIASMHYVGMEGMTDSMTIHYLPGLFILSIIIAILASEAALWLALKSNQVVARIRVRLKIISAFIMGAAICGMHYTGMAAAIFTPNNAVMQMNALNPQIMSISIACITFIILGIAFFVSTYKESLNQQLLLNARQAGMAEVAASVLHNVGNVLNSINVSATLLNEQITKSNIEGLVDLSKLLDEHKNDLINFITKDSKGNQIVDYINSLALCWNDEKKFLYNEIAVLLKNIEHVKNIIAMQQELSKSEGFEQIVDINEIIEEAIAITGLDTSRSEIKINKQYESLHHVLIDKVKLLQILVNLLRNAKDSLTESKNEPKIIDLKIGIVNKETFYIKVTDNGLGVLPANLTRIFGYGFTTKVNGHGYGLHSSALAANEMGGSINVVSEGYEKGAAFTMTLPYKVSKRVSKKKVAEAVE